MLETPFPFFVSKKPDEIPIFGTFLEKQLIFFFSILVYFHWNSAFWVRPCLKTSLWSHTLTDFPWFWYQWKEEKPTLYHWYQTNHTLGLSISSSWEGWVTTPLGKPCYKKRLGRTRVKDFFRPATDNRGIMLWRSF